MRRPGRLRAPRHAARQVLVLGGRASSAPLRRWVQLELNGYDDAVEEIPDYRTFCAQIQINGLFGFQQVTGMPISSTALPEAARDCMTEDVTLTWTVGEIEAHVANTPPGETIKLAKAKSSDLATLMTMDQQRKQNNPHVQIYDVYWAVSPASLRGVLDRIRTRLTGCSASASAAARAHRPRPRAD